MTILKSESRSSELRLFLFFVPMAATSERRRRNCRNYFASSFSRDYLELVWNRLHETFVRAPPLSRSSRCLTSSPLSSPREKEIMLNREGKCSVRSWKLRELCELRTKFYVISNYLIKLLTPIIH